MKLVCQIGKTENGIELYYPSLAVKSELLRLLESVQSKYNSYVSIEIKKPYKPRTTGKNSQNNLFWKLVEIIADETGEELHVIENELKQKAITKGYPSHISKISGKPIPESTTKVNTVEMSYLIDTAYEVIAFLGIILEPDTKQAYKDQSQNYDIF